jgi:hypothetical protein
MDEVKWENIEWTDNKGEPSVQIEYAYVDGRTTKKFVYNQNTFPNLRTEHGEGCDCDYCTPFSTIIPSPPLPGVEEMIVMTIDKTWDVKPRTNGLGEEIEYVELPMPILDSIYHWETAQEDWLHQQSVATQEEMEIFINVESTTDYQEENDLKGIVACYVNVAHDMSADHQWLVDEYQKAWEPLLDKVPKDWEIVWVTTLDGDSRVEMLRF